MYKQINDIFGNNTNTIYRIADSAFIPIDPANTDYQEYLEWVEDGNTIEDAD